MRLKQIVKGTLSQYFPAIFNTVGLKPWLSTIAHTRNVPGTSREEYKVNIEGRGTVIHFKLLFQAKMTKLEKFSLKFSSSELEFLLLS